MEIRRNIEVPLSLAQICRNLKMKYKTVRTHSCRDPNFPEPIMRRIDGDGLNWLQTEVEHYYETKPDGRRKKKE